MTIEIGRRSMAIAASATLAAGLLTAGVTSASAAPMVGVNDCGSLESKPKELVLACADANEYLDNVKWKSWKKNKAKGTATYKVNNCDPTCADGTWESYKVRVTLKKPKTQSGEKVYSEVVLRFPKAVPDGKKKKEKETLGWYSPVEETMPMDEETPEPSATPTPYPSESGYETPDVYATPTPTPTPYPSESVYETPDVYATPTPTATENYTEAEEMVDVMVPSQRKTSGKLKVTIEAESSAGGERKGIKSVKVKRKNDVGGTLTYEASWAGSYRPSTWTVTTGCNSRWRDEMTIEVTSNSGKVTTYKTDAQSGC